MSKALQTIREALFETGLVQPVSSGGRGGSVFCLCRQLPGQEKNWLKAVDQLLLSSEDWGVDIHVCRRYVRKEGRMVFGWYLGVEAKNTKRLVEIADLITTVLKSTENTVEPVILVAPAVVKFQPLNRTPIPGTSAGRRLPENLGPDPVPPTGKKLTVRMVAPGVQEMPLPHIYTEMNRPKPGSNRGAATMGSNAELFKGLGSKGEGS